MTISVVFNFVDRMNVCHIILKVFLVIFSIQFTYGYLNTNICNLLLIFLFNSIIICDIIFDIIQLKLVNDQKYVVYSGIFVGIFIHSKKIVSLKKAQIFNKYFLCSSFIITVNIGRMNAYSKSTNANALS